MIEIRGGYILLLKNGMTRKIRVGKRILYFDKGYYIYCGSAMNDLEKRVSRHFSKEKKFRWHIDYISVEMQPLIAFAISSDKKIECSLSEILKEFFRGFDEFGASDCKCKTHLFYSSSDPIHQLEVLLRLKGFSFTKIPANRIKRD